MEPVFVVVARGSVLAVFVGIEIGEVLFWVGLKVFTGGLMVLSEKSFVRLFAPPKNIRTVKNKERLMMTAEMMIAWGIPRADILCLISICVF